VVVELDRKLARITEAHYGVFTREQAVGLGFSESACDRRVAVGAWESVHRGVYRLGGSGRTFEQSVLAACLAAPGTKGRKGGRLLAELIEERQGRKRHADSEPQRILQAALEARALKGEYEYEILLPDGTSVFADVAFPEKRLIVEVDSYEHHSSLTDWARDQARNSALVAMGWRVLVVTTLELLENPQRVAARIGCALAA
jgi:very-short-patch-repair endonuclease